MSHIHQSPIFSFRNAQDALQIRHWVTERLRNSSKVLKPHPGVTIQIQVFRNPESTLWYCISCSVIIGAGQRLEKWPQTVGKNYQVRGQNHTFLPAGPASNSLALHSAVGGWSRMTVALKNGCAQRHLTVLQGTWGFNFGWRIRFSVLTGTLWLEVITLLSEKVVEIFLWVLANLQREMLASLHEGGGGWAGNKPAPESFSIQREGWRGRRPLLLGKEPLTTDLLSGCTLHHTCLLFAPLLAKFCWKW